MKKILLLLCLLATDRAFAQCGSAGTPVKLNGITVCAPRMSPTFSGNVTIGGAVPAGGTRLAVKGSASTADVGNTTRLTADGTFATSSGWTVGANWTISAGKATHSAGATAALSGTTTAVSGGVYQITATISGRTAGTLTAYLGSGESSSQGMTTSTTYTFELTAVADNPALVLTPSSDFDGAIDDITLYLITPSTPDVEVEASNGTNTPVEIRSVGVNNIGAFGIGLNAFRYASALNARGVAVGPNAGQQFVAGYASLFGLQSGDSLLEGNATLLGYQAGFSTQAADITCVGHQACYSNVNGNLTALGHQTLYASTVSNAAVGDWACKSATTGGCTGLGYSPLRDLTTGSAVAVGNLAALNLTTGSGVFIGHNVVALTNPAVTDTQIVAIGNNIDKSSSTARTNVIVIGHGATYGGQDNQVILGNSSITTTLLKGMVGIGITDVADQMTRQLNIVGADSSTTAVNPGVSMVFRNTDSTANNRIGLAVWNSSSGSYAGGIVGVNTDNSNSYGEISFITRSSVNLVERARITGDGLSVVGKLYVAQQTPATAAATCTANQFAFDTGFLYVCTASNTWKRVAIATW